MPFKSEAQRRFFHAATEPGFRGDADITKKDVKKWEKETPEGKELPERVKKAHLRLAFTLGRRQAFEEATKEAGLESGVASLLGRTAPLWAPAVAGGVVAGPEHRLEGSLAGLGLGILGKRIGLAGLRRGMFDPGELQKAMSAAKLRETAQGYKKLTKVPMESRAYKSINRALGEEGAPQFWENVAAMKARSPAAAWGGRIAGGLGGGLLAKELLSQKPGSSPFQTSPAVSDMSTHYTGLVPGEEYY